MTLKIPFLSLDSVLTNLIFLCQSLKYVQNYKCAISYTTFVFKFFIIAIVSVCCVYVSMHLHSLRELDDLRLARTVMGRVGSPTGGDFGHGLPDTRDVGHLQC